MGVGLGVLSCFAFATAGRGLEASSAFEEASGMFEHTLVPGWSEMNGWFLEHTPSVGWGWAVLFGIFLGSYWSARIAGAPKHAPVPPLWRRRFGRAASRRMAWAFVAGALIMFGARLAGGCAIGHGITGALSFAVSSWAFLAVAFAAAVATAFTLFGGVGGGRARLPR